MSHPVAPGTHPPLLIWTLQRSGGTNLTRQLEVLAGLPRAEHEPFNPDREFGHLTSAWITAEDGPALEAGMQAACRQRGLIKHCVELVPWEVSQALARQAVALGFRHLFLYREQPRERLLSLIFAKRSGVWAPGQARKKLGDLAPLVSEALPVRWLVERERLSAQRLNQAWQWLRQAGQQPHALSFESVYRVPVEDGRTRLQHMLEALDLSSGDAAVDADFACQVLDKGDQKTRASYADFRGIARLDKALEAVERFQPD